MNYVVLPPPSISEIAAFEYFLTLKDGNIAFASTSLQVCYMCSLVRLQGMQGFADELSELCYTSPPPSLSLYIYATYSAAVFSLTDIPGCSLPNPIQP